MNDEFAENAAEERETVENSSVCKGAPPVPYIVYEGERARNERLVSRLIGIITLLIFTLAATNAFWLYEWMQYDFESTTTTSADIEQFSDSDGNYNFIGNEGDINNGTTKDKSDNDKENLTETQEQ